MRRCVYLSLINFLDDDKDMFLTLHHTLCPFPGSLCAHLCMYAYVIHGFRWCAVYETSLYLWTFLLTRIHRRHRCCHSRHPYNVLPAWNAIFSPDTHSGNVLFMRLSFSVVIFCTYVQKEFTFVYNAYVFVFEFEFVCSFVRISAFVSSCVRALDCIFELSRL